MKNQLNLAHGTKNEK